MQIPSSIHAVTGGAISESVTRPEESATDGSGFATLVEGLLENTELQQDQIGTEVQKVLTGESSSLHEVSLAVANADLSFRFMMQLRDQLIQTYREVMRMQV
ncbi:UNVERIFIED_CONTAM: hypothetical protein GTU68_025009 [Idotea baltica]|nr:hypothetical protein [Idotea baltica]